MPHLTIHTHSHKLVSTAKWFLSSFYIDSHWRWMHWEELVDQYLSQRYFVRQEQPEFKLPTFQSAHQVLIKCALLYCNHTKCKQGKSNSNMEFTAIKRKSYKWILLNFKTILYIYFLCGIWVCFLSCDHKSLNIVGHCFLFFFSLLRLHSQF